MKKFNMNKIIRLFILDVDGVLTNGTIWYAENGHEYKAFHTQDGLGLKKLQRAGVEIAVISGRSSPAVNRRLHELKINKVFQGITNKRVIFDELISEMKINPENVASIGDDLPDEPLLINSGIAIAVNNAVPEIKKIADYCTLRSGGEGAVREACDWLLHHVIKHYEPKNTPT